MKKDNIELKMHRDDVRVNYLLHLGGNIYDFFSKLINFFMGLFGLRLVLYVLISP